jgi:hypothetical protein
LGQDAGDASHCQDSTHLLLVPSVVGQVNGKEGADARLNIGQKKIKPVQSPQGAAFFVK